MDEALAEIETYPSANNWLRFLALLALPGFVGKVVSYALYLVARHSL